MNWSHDSIPAMRLETRFGDRVVPAFCERPNSIWAMVSEAAASNPDGEALVCGERRMPWCEVAQQSACVAAGLRKIGLQSGDRVALLLGNRFEFVLAMFGAAHLGLVTVLLSPRQQKAGDRICAVRLRCQAPDPRGQAIRPSARFPRCSRADASG